MKAQKFCIITTARCGSNALVSLLSLVPGCVCHGELFSTTGTWVAPQPRLVLPHSIADRNRDPLGFLREVERQSLEHASTVGFKLFIMHNSKVLEHVVSSGEYRIILLSRANMLAQYASLAAAEASGVWRSRTKSSADAVPATRFDNEEFNTFVVRTSQRYQNVRSRLATRNRPYFSLEYLDINNGMVIDALGEFLGTEKGGSLSAMISSIPDVKQGSRAIIDRFSNREDVVAAMRELGHEDWLKEGNGLTHV